MMRLIRFYSWLMEGLDDFATFLIVVVFVAIAWVLGIAAIGAVR